MKFTVALAQIDNVLGDVAKNVRKHVAYVRRAKEGGADLVVFPELSLSGYSMKDSTRDAALRPGSSALLDPLIAESHGIAVLAGAVEESDGYGLYNSAFLFEGGTVRSVHRKVYPASYGMFEELRYFSPGTGVQAFDARIGRVGVLICEDLWHLPLPYLLAQDGAQVIFGMAASPTRLAGSDAMIQNAQINTGQHTAYARLLSVYVIFCNRVGYEDGVNFWGGSGIVGPDGSEVVRAKLFDEDIVFADIDGNEVRRARQFSRHFLDEDPHLVARTLRRITGR